MSSEPLPDLPQDLIDDILHRLPAKSIGRFRSVSKHYQSYLSTPQFVKTHNEYFKTNRPENLLCFSDQSLSVLTFSTDGSKDGDLRKIKSPFEKRVCFEVAGSCNGLVLLEGCRSHRWEDKYLMNPITLESERVIDDSHNFDGLKACGLGYDDSKDDYKIVLISLERNLDRRVMIYSFKMKTWRIVSDSGRVNQGHFAPKCHRKGVFVNGCIHWLACPYPDRPNSSYLVLSFDLAREKFVDMPLPSAIELQFKSNRYCDIRVLRGCLTLMFYRSSSIDFWVMREYGVRDSWTKLTTFDCPEFNRLYDGDRVFLLNEYELVMKMLGKTYILCDSQNGVWRLLEVSGECNYDGEGLGKVCGFSESLVSLPIM